MTIPLMLSPGPANLVSLVLASRHGARRVLSFQMGILIVYGVVAFSLALTAKQLGERFDDAAVFLQVAGGGLIVYLGGRLMLTTPRSDEHAQVPTFKTGALLQVFNPKFPPVVLAVLSARTGTNPMLTAGVVVFVGACGLALYSGVGSQFRRFAVGERRMRLLDIVFGALLVAVGLWVGGGPFFKRPAPAVETVSAVMNHSGGGVDFRCKRLPGAHGGAAIRHRGLFQGKTFGDFRQVVLVSQHDDDVAGVQDHFWRRIQFDGIIGASDPDDQESVISSDLDFAHGSVGEI